MRQPDAVSRPPTWAAIVLVLLVIGALIAVGWRPGATSDIEATSLPPTTTLAVSSPPPSTTLAPPPEVTAVSPTFTLLDIDGAEAPAELLGGTLAALIGSGETDLLLFTFGDEGGERVVHDMPRDTYGLVRFDWSRNQYAFTDSGFRLHVRPTKVAPGDVAVNDPIAINVRSFAWALDEPGRIAWLTLTDDGPLLVESTGQVREVGNPGDVNLVGLDSTGFYIFGGDTGAAGEAWLRKLTPDLDHVLAEVPADVVHLGTDGLVVIGQAQPGEQDGPLAVDWYLTDQSLFPLTPIVGPPPSAIAIATNHRTPRAVAFLTFDGQEARVEVYRTESGLTQTFDLGKVRAWEVQWSDDDRFIVVSGTEQSDRGHLVQLVDAYTGLITAVGFDDWVQSAQLIRQSDPSPTAGGFDETAGCQPTVPPRSGFEVPGDRQVTPPHVWYGNPELWTVLAEDGAYGERKSVWWSSNFPGGSIEESPDISVVARRLDANVADVTSESLGTNAFTSADGDFMIADFPTRLATGCWQVTGTYKGVSLSYVVDVP